MGGKRSFGTVRQLRSRRWQARYTGPDGLVRPAPHTFDRRRDAEVWLAKTHADIARDDWIDPDGGWVPLSEYASGWVRDHAALGARTRERYEDLLRLHIDPYIGGRPLVSIKEANVRQWRQQLLGLGVGPPTVAKSYRLLRAIMNTAVDDLLIRRNPCRIKGAGEDRSPHGRSCPSRRSMPSPSRCHVSTARWSSSRRSAASGSASWRRCGARTSTWAMAAWS